MRRRQRADLVPAKLLTFDPKDWTTSAEENRWPLWQRWAAARKTWATEHPDSTALGNALERFKFELDTLLPGSTGKARREEDLSV